MDLTEKELATLRHMLGLTDFSKRDAEPYRNYFEAAPDDRRFDRMEALGLVVKARPPAPGRECPVYAATEAGRAVAIRDFMARRYPKKRRVYHRFLSVSDAVPGLTFREFLVEPEYADIRASA